MAPVYGRGRPLIVHSFRRAIQTDRNEKLAEEVAFNVLSALTNSEAVPSSAGVISPAGISSLTRREAEILMLLSRSMGTKEIADHLCVSRSTVRTHVQNILETLGVHSKLEAVTLVFRQGLFQNECAVRHCPPSRYPTLPE
jgi:DNA-binding NarL/FixJ family response regulator